MPFPFYHQHDAMDCGPACLRMVAAHHGRHFNLQTLSRESHLDREGVSLAGISKAAEAIGFRTMPVKIPFASEEDRPGLTGAPLPCIVHWNQQHFVVVFKISKSEIHIADPA
ncbi:MAG TPA: cysteine peptidase family C39 domain-containing protein, partial [Saprospiraceae bacterium]|nr:cysteine peptidase family C39 domain-containing protein [Saprospiraceae bacterium]